ncbi:ABC transporter ATP-binding protein/permease [Streptomyces sp. OUCMDZ-4982]|uniref:ABC transporter transmembrane domain-containing protein n=1 Tax=Streptomyces sp. OUCMDZ-4982 TaxID=2973090 RepID=UPI00215BC23A|nr:ABC transporter ATP-binding protein [Streptomyces sp. OUCMDZ-4982]MCR8945351.1 ABC transporter ATP-binding protein/permease [Streptomyces sp. OUCMDZ-4982]
MIAPPADPSPADSPSTPSPPPSSSSPSPPPTAPPSAAPPSADALVRRGSFGAGRGRRLAVAGAGFAGHQVAEALVPVLLGVVVDRAIGRGEPGALVGLLATLGGLFAVLIVCWRTGSRLTTGVYVYGEHDLRLLAADRVLHPAGLAGRRPPGEALTIATSDASNVSGVSWLIAEQGAALAGLLTAALSLFLVSWQLAAVVLAATAAQLVVLHLLSGPLERRAYAEQREAARAGALATDFTAGFRALKGFGAEGAAARRYREASRSSMRAALRRVHALAGLTALNSAVSGAFLAGIALLAAWHALEGRITVGEFVTAVGLAQVVAGPMQTLGFFGASVAAKRGSAHRLAELLAEPYAVREHPRDSQAASPEALFAMRHGSVTVTARPGELIGVRACGAAAEEVTALAACRREPAPGQYTVAGRDAYGLSPDDVRRTVHAPPHGAAVFTGTVAENLVTETVRAAAVTASGLDDVLTHLPDGLGSPVGEQGRFLSGGQRQRLLLARALHQPQPVLVLHEPTTSVDTVTEDRIARNLRGAARNPHGEEDRAIVLVTTSPTLLGACDRVYDLTAETVTTEAAR